MLPINARAEARFCGYSCSAKFRNLTRPTPAMETKLEPIDRPMAKAMAESEFNYAGRRVLS